MLVIAQKLQQKDSLNFDQNRIESQPSSRYSKLRSKKVIFPDNTLNKIVFVSNAYGNGFRRQSYQTFDVPAHIDLNKMLYQIDLTCFKIWETNAQRQQSDQLINFKYTIWIIFMLTLLLGTIVIVSSPFDISTLQVFSYIFSFIAIICIIVASLLFCQKKQQFNYDYGMIYGIKRKLMEINQEQYQNFTGNARFVWSCHKQCLWIAITFK